MRDSMGKQVAEVDFHTDGNGRGRRHRRGARVPRPKKLN